jgi:cell division septation protein DedD
VSATRSAYANYRAAQNSIASHQSAVTANEVALEGARAERSVGTRTVLDVLNAEQELLNAQVALVTARRNAYVAGFQLLNAMGQAEADDLGLEGGPLYDPLSNYRRVARNWSDWADDAQHVRVATRTVAVERTTATESPQPTTRPIMSSEQSQNGVAPSVKVATGRSVSQAGAAPPMTGSGSSTTSKKLDKAMAPIAGRGWRLQLGTFSTRAAAEALYQRLSVDGLMAGWQPAYVAFGNLTRLQIGHYARRSEAATACRELVGRGQPCFATAAK